MQPAGRNKPCYVVSGTGMALSEPARNQLAGRFRNVYDIGVSYQSYSASNVKIDTFQALSPTGEVCIIRTDIRRAYLAPPFEGCCCAFIVTKVEADMTQEITVGYIKYYCCCYVVPLFSTLTPSSAIAPRQPYEKLNDFCIG